jgi:hypothetical protein
MPFSDPERRADYRRKYERKRAKERPEYMLYKAARKRARDKGLDFNLTPEDIIIPQVCPYLLIPITPNAGGKSRLPGSPSLDRLDNDRGYVVGNIIVCSWRANRLKADSDFQELLLLVNNWGAILRSK